MLIAEPTGQTSIAAPPGRKESGAGEIRPLNSSDIPAVSQLFQKKFRSPNVAAPDSLTAYLRQLFLEYPARTSQIGSRVFVGANEQILGFIGVLPLTLESSDRHWRAAVAGSLMVDDPLKTPTAGARLLRSVFHDSQEITISESANQLSQRMWERLGGKAVPAYSLEWIRVLQPAALALALATGGRTAVRFLPRLAIPVDRALHALKLNPFPIDSDVDGIQSVAIDDQELISVLPQFLANYAIRPRWDDLSLSLILRHAATKERYGSLERRLVYGRRGKPIGAYLYYCSPNRIGFVLQILTSPEHVDTVVEDLFRHAFINRCVGLRGRAQPEITDALLRHRCLFGHSSSMVVASKDPALIRTIRIGDALITGLAAESWTRLIGGEFL